MKIISNDIGRQAGTSGGRHESGYA